MAGSTVEQDVESLQKSLDRLRHEVADLQASRQRLVEANDADRRELERELHDGPQQHLVALSVSLQLARRLADTDPGAASAIIDEMSRDVRQALDQTAKLAQRIYPPLLEAGGLAPALREAARSVGVQAHIDVAASTDYPREVAGAVYFSCLDVLERARPGARVTITMRDDERTLVFELIVGDSPSPTLADDLGRLRDRVGAIGGTLTIRPDPGGARVSGSLPLAR